MKRFEFENGRIVIPAVIVAAVIAAVVAAIQVGRQGSKGSGLGSEYRLDLSSMSHIDPELILYEETGNPIRTGLFESRALTMGPSGILYVAGDETVKIIAPEGRMMNSLPLTVSPRCLAATEELLYIGTWDRVLVVGINGKIQADWPSLGEDARITSIAVDDEHVFVADAGQRVVWCFDRTGRLIRRIGDKDPEKGIPGFVIPSPYFDLAMAPDGLLRVANTGRQLIEAYTVDGDRELAWGKFGNNLEDFTSCCNPVNFAVLSDGSIVTCEKGIVRVKVYDGSGRLTGVVAGPRQFAGDARSTGGTPAQDKQIILDVAVDDADRVYILDRARNVVQVFAKKEA